MIWEVSLARFKPTTNKGEFNATSYGEGKELDDLQSGAEMFVDESISTGLQQANVNPEPVVNARNIVQDIKRPTEFPGQDVAGNNIAGLGQSGVMEANMILRAMYRVLPSKDILALMDEDILPGG